MAKRKTRKGAEKVDQPAEAPMCLYCNVTSELVTAQALYPNREDLAHKRFYRCPVNPDHYVGCHDGTTQPLGRLADAELRIGKVSAHAVFDPLWEAKMRRDGCSKSAARKAAYLWLAGELGIHPGDCHIGMMDIPTIHRVVRICRAARKPKEPANADA